MRRNFTKYDIWGFFPKTCRENKAFIKILRRIADTFHEDVVYIYDTRNIVLNSFYDEKCSTPKMRRKSTGAFCFQYSFSASLPRKIVPFMRPDVWRCYWFLHHPLHVTVTLGKNCKYFFLCNWIIMKMPYKNLTIWDHAELPIISSLYLFEVNPSWCSK